MSIIYSSFNNGHRIHNTIHNFNGIDVKQIKENPDVTNENKYGQQVE